MQNITDLFSLLSRSWLASINYLPIKNKKIHTTEDLACYSHSNHQTESDRAAFERHMCTGREATKAAVGADAPTTKLKISANNQKNYHVCTPLGQYPAPTRATKTS